MHLLNITCHCYCGLKIIFQIKMMKNDLSNLDIISIENGSKIDINDAVKQFVISK